jgi:hypothetical protein
LHLAQGGPLFKKLPISRENLTVRFDKVDVFTSGGKIDKETLRVARVFGATQIGANISEIIGDAFSIDYR